MLSRFSSLKCVAVNVSKFITTRKITPVSNLLLHTSATNKNPNEGLVPTAESQENAGRKVAVLLAGCGGLDGSDPYEVINLVVYLHYKGFTVEFFAPGRRNDPVMDHNTKTPENSPDPLLGLPERFVHLEAERLVHREQDRVQYIHHLTPSNYEALYIPGGRGVINHMLENHRAPYRPPVHIIQTKINEFIQDNKPIGTISSGGIVVATVYKSWQALRGNFRYTMGTKDTLETSSHSYDAFQLADELDPKRHEPRKVGIVSSYKFVSTPGMIDAKEVPLARAYQSIRDLVNEVTRLMNINRQ